MKEVIQMTPQDYVKFLTEQLVTRMDRSQADKIKDKSNKEVDTFSNKWFGLFPFSLKMLTKR